ncbi:MBG domain-containing protein [Dactylosporangium sp. NPDC005555]|uniref:MBG domain-containing protein n=1 Tax=Dactylosporangium sp. NPDC005555 TaxID=3154889 RepID=UPI00339F6E89
MTDSGRLRRTYRVLSLLLLLVQGAFLAAGVRPAGAAGPDAVVTDAGCLSTYAARTDDGSSGPVPLGFPVNFFGTTYNDMYVNNNGDVTFGSPYSGYSGLNLAAFGSPIIAVAFFDVDTRPGGTTPVSYGPITYSGRPAFCVNWVDVGYYSNGSDRLNSSQLIIVDRSDTGAGNFDIVMNYDRLAYEPAGGLTVGYSNGTFTYVYPGSGVAGALVDANTSTGLIRNSGGGAQLGRYVHQVRGGQPSAPGAQSITFPAVGDVTYGVAPFTLSPTASSGLTVALTAAGACTVSGSTVTVTGAGSCTLTAGQPGDGTYTAAAPVSRTFQIAKTPVSVSLSGLGQTYDGTERKVTVTADPDPGNGAVAVTYDGSATAPTSAGTYAVQAAYTSATHTGTASGTLVVARAPQRITFPEIVDRRYGGDPIHLAATSDSGLPVRFTVTGPCAADGGTLTVTGAGQCTVTATQAGDADRLAAAPVARSFAVAKGAVTITLGGLSQVYNGTSRAVTTSVVPSAAGAVHVTYNGSGTPPTTAGTYRVVATVDGADYEGTLTATLTVAKATQDIDFAQPAAATYGDAPRALRGASSARLPVRFTATGSCDLRSGALAYTRGGECVVTAHQDGDANRLAATDVVRSVEVARAVQTVTLTVPRRLAVGGDAGTLTAGSTAGLPVQVTAAGTCEVRTVDAGTALAPTHAGTCTVTAAQAGDESYLPATAATATTSVDRGAATLRVRALSQVADGSPRTAEVSTTPAGLTGTTVTYDARGQAPKASGTYRIVATLDNPDWTAAPVIAKLTVAQAAAAPVKDPATGARPALTPNAAMSTVDGKAAPVTITPATGGGVTLTGGGFTAAVAAVGADSTGQPLDADGKLVVDRKHQVSVSMTGFAPNTRTDVWLFSDPVLIGQVTTDAKGTVDAKLPVPATLPTGQHALQVNGVTADGAQRSLSVGLLLVDDPAVAAPATAPATAPTTTGTGTDRPAVAAPALPDAVDALAQLPAYIPAAHADAVVTTAIAGFTLLAITAGAGGAAVAGGGTTRAGSRQGGGQRKAGKIASGSAKHFKEKWAGGGWGDTSFSWRMLPTGWLDRRSLDLPQRVAPKSPLLARILTDGSYLRAMLGGAWWAMPAAGAVLGVTAAVQSHGSPLPGTGIMLALVVLGIFDGFAGLAAALGFATVVVATGGVTSTDTLRLLLGVCAMWFAIALLAGVVRPFRRPTPQTALDWWTRGADVFIASLMGGWAVQKSIGALSGLAGHQLPIAAHADRFALFALAAIATRIVLETLAGWAYPSRLGAVRPEKLQKAGKVQRLSAIGLRTGMFIFVAVPFLGTPWQLWVGAALFGVPQVLSVYEDAFPNLPKLFGFLPKRIVKTVFMMLVGTLSGLALAWLIDDPASRIVNGFVLLSLPGLVFSLIELFGREGEERSQSWRRELAGGAVVAVGIAAAFGVFS